MRSRYSTGRASKRVKVAHRLTPYDYALRSVILGDAADPPGECKNILEGEALMENTQNRAQYYATQRHVHSDQSGVARGQTLQQKLKNLRFAGFSVTGYDTKYSVYEQGFMSTIGGVNTVINTGDGALETGLEVYVLPTEDPNNTSIKGVHRLKNLFATVHAQLTPDNKIPTGASNIFKSALLAAAAITSPLKAPRNTVSENSFNGIAPAAGVVGRVMAPIVGGPPLFDDSDRQKAVNFLRKFCVGTCIRGARKGQPFDIVLHASANILHVGN